MSNNEIDFSDKEQLDREIDRLVDIGINKMITQLNVNIVDKPEPVVEIDPEYGVDKEFLDTPVLYKKPGKTVERMTFRELASIVKTFDCIYYRNNLNQQDGPDHNGIELNHKINYQNLKIFFKKLGFRISVFGLREDPTYDCVII